MNNQYSKELCHSQFQGSELYHHGILGMHWGIRRYQPYGHGYDPQHKGKFIGDKKEYRKATKDIRNARREAHFYEQAVKEADKSITKYTDKIQKLEQNPKYKKQLERAKTNLSSAKTAAELLQRCKKQKLKEIKNIEKKTGIDASTIKKGLDLEKTVQIGATGAVFAAFAGLAAATAPFLSIPATVAASVGGLVNGLSLSSLAMSTGSVAANRYGTAYRVVSSLLKKGIEGKDISSMPIHEFMQLYDKELRKQTMASSMVNSQIQQQMHQQIHQQIHQQMHTEMMNQINNHIANELHTQAMNMHMGAMGMM